MRTNRRGFLQACAAGVFALAIEWRLGSPAPKALVGYDPSPHTDDFSRWAMLDTRQVRIMELMMEDIRRVQFRQVDEMAMVDFVAHTWPKGVE